MNTKVSFKKIFSLLLCCCMLLSMNVPAFAENAAECSHGAATAPVAATCTTDGNENVV